MRFKTAVVIGRFQPFHAGHAELIAKARERAENVVVIIGSAHGPRNLRNPFTADERVEMLKGVLGDTVTFATVRDYFYNNEGWINEVRSKVAGDSVALVGHSKDETSAYLKWFPGWDVIEIPADNDRHATDLRAEFFRSGRTNNPDLPPAIQSWLEKFKRTSTYADLRYEQEQIDAYKKSWASAPFPPVFVTTDALLVCCDHILLIQRKKSPGRGLWALPGGFLDPNEVLFQCALRELEEETTLTINPSSFVKARVFDHPLRSSRGRTITHAHLFRLKEKTLPKVKASDDAADAKWVPLLDIGKMESLLFEDHFHIVNFMLRVSD